MDRAKWEEFCDLAGWLFEAAPDRCPQIGVSDAHKRALVWCPGNRPLQGPMPVSRATYAGCTQLAFERPDKMQCEQTCWICWIGLDIDDQPGLDLNRLVAALPPEASLRSSASGRGVHVIVRLERALGPMLVQSAHKMVKQIGRGLAREVEAAGIKVCQCDRRMFWLVGGSQAWIKRTDRTALIATALEPVVCPAVAAAVEPAARSLVAELRPGVAQWVERFAASGIRLRQGSNPVFIHECANVVEAHGERVQTKSHRGGGRRMNGFIEVAPHRIWMRAWADGGGTVWCYEEVEL